MTDTTTRPAEVARSSNSLEEPGDPDVHTVPNTASFVAWSDSQPAALLPDGSSFAGRAGVPLVEIFTAEEQRARTSQAYVRSAVGERLRVIDTTRSVEHDQERLTVRQRDPRTGIEVDTRLTRPAGTRVLRIENTIRNSGPAPIVVTAVTSATLAFASAEADLDDVTLALADSEWLAENRWHERPLRESVPTLSLGIHEQDGRGHFRLASHGAWSTGEHLPAGVLTHRPTGEAIAWQVETSVGWQIDVSQTAQGGVLSLLGPTDLAHQFAHRLGPGDAFHAVPAAIAVSDAGRDGAIAELTAYRRWLRGSRVDKELPIVYNDFMNTLMGQPTTEKLLPLIDAAANAGAEVFCIDAGWFAEPSLGDWWSTVGEWVEAESRFASGLKELTDEIGRRGMRVGLWLEPEVVGIESPAAAALPEHAFFQRFGRRVQEHGRFHLDFRHPAARAHVDEVVDRIVRDYDVSFIKLDYNINAGPGTEWNADAPGDGLLAHSRAFQAWLLDIQARHPGLLIENCSSGAMRADYSLLRITHMQSTSDQQDYLLYPPIAASAPMTILPEQCGNWAYPNPEMNDEETVFSLVTGLSGRLYLSGFLADLSDAQRTRIADAVIVHKSLRTSLPEAIPFWPLGLPAWDDDLICLGLHIPDGDLIFLWDRAESSSTARISGVGGPVTPVFPAELGEWSVRTDVDDLVVSTSAGVAARVLLVGPRSTGIQIA